MWGHYCLPAFPVNFPEAPAWLLLETEHWVIWSYVSSTDLWGPKRWGTHMVGHTYGFIFLGSGGGGFVTCSPCV